MKLCIGLIRCFSPRNLVGILFWYFGLFVTVCIVIFWCIPDTYSEHESLTKQKLKSFLVVLILSSPSAPQAREAIRKTWFNLLSHKNKSTAFLFAVGRFGLNNSLLAQLNEEQNAYGDMLFLPDLVDSYFNLTIKVLKSFQWIDLNMECEYLLKLDDDSFARLDLIVQELNNLKPKRFYWGYFSGNARVKRSGKWAEHDWIMCDYYVPYARGGGYVISSDLIHYIASNAEYLQIFKSEDVSVGAWLGPLTLKRVHDERFDTEYISRGCNNSFLVTHKQHPNQMYAKYKEIQENGRLCNSEFRTRHSYVYDWHVPPSNCCIKQISNINTL